jgi:hypothetical protein
MCSYYDHLLLNYGTLSYFLVASYLLNHQLCASLANHSSNHHIYADDTQLFTSFCPDKFQQAISHLQLALQHISDWMSANLLTLNPSKTAFLLIGLPKQLATISNPSLSPIPATVILPSPSARNLGFIVEPI